MIFKTFENIKTVAEGVILYLVLNLSGTAGVLLFFKDLRLYISQLVIY